MELPNGLVIDLVFNPSHIIFASSVSKKMEGEIAKAIKVVEVAKHATKEHLALEK
jgi:hypothetical protein